MSVAALIDAFGGRIEVESTLGEGSTFTLTLPQRCRTELAPPPTPADVGDARRRILIIDAEPLVLSAASRMLGPHDVEYAAGGRAALEKLDQDSSFDLVLGDLTGSGGDARPDRHGGLRACRA